MARRTDPELLAAAAAVLARQPRATMAAIAAGAGISRATLHRAFPAREDLLRALALDAIAAAEQAVMAAARKRRGALDELFAALVPLGARFHFLVQEEWIDRDRRLRARQAALLARLDALLERGRAGGELRRDVPLEWQRRVLLEIVWAAWAAVAEGTLGHASAPRLARETFLDGARAGGR
jgi:AcrR family transcriptional regulator